VDVFRSVTYCWTFCYWCMGDWCTLKPRLCLLRTPETTSEDVPFEDRQVSWCNLECEYWNLLPQSKHRTYSYWCMGDWCRLKPRLCLSWNASTHRKMFLLKIDRYLNLISNVNIETSPQTNTEPSVTDVWCYWCRLKSHLCLSWNASTHRKMFLLKIDRYLNLI